MKVICAGMIKTGTKSMTEALRILGFSVYDYMENLEYLGDDWLKLLEKGGGPEDFRRMYENVDAVADVPPAHFWDEIHKAFPESKIILTMRDTEEEWIKSVDKQMKAVGIPILFFIRFFSPTGRKMMYYSSLVANAVFGHDSKFSFFKPPSLNNFLMKMAYRRHNLHVIQNAPKDKLLIYNVKEGWKPLCEFLGVEVPDVPFPRKNVGGSIVDEWLERPAIKKMKLEILCSMTAIVTVSSYFGYKLVYGGWGNGIWSACLRIFD